MATATSQATRSEEKERERERRPVDVDPALLAKIDNAGAPVRMPPQPLPPFGTISGDVRVALEPL